MRKAPVLYIVIPCYNEETVLPVTAPMFLKKIQELITKGEIAPASRIMFVNDGSTDNTWNIIYDLSESDEHYIGISQSRNRGHQNAVLAGLMESQESGICDITISIDCDGQDDINAMDEMVKQYRNGYEVVYGVRNKRETDTFFKRFTAQTFYKLLNWMGAEVIYNHADYRLISCRVLKELAEFKEVNIYLRGLVPLVGFRSTQVYYERHERLAGKSHYPLSKMLGLALDGITSLSIKPIRMIAGVGTIVSFMSFLLIIWILVQFFRGEVVQGWASTCAIMCLVCGIQLICTGIIGEYVGKIYMETKARPRYIISDRTYEKRDDDEEDKSIV
ncbi:MAG: glycosyltransferase family 2 protein [Eubacteriales bacterium]|nr:glycosyltransferase family 2 protein [Eubacteriales bacterium]